MEAVIFKITGILRASRIIPRSRTCPHHVVLHFERVWSVSDDIIGTVGFEGENVVEPSCAATVHVRAEKVDRIVPLRQPYGYVDFPPFVWIKMWSDNGIVSISISRPAVIDQITNIAGRPAEIRIGTSPTFEIGEENFDDGLAVFNRGGSTASGIAATIFPC